MLEQNDLKQMIDFSEMHLKSCYWSIWFSSITSTDQDTDILNINAFNYTTLINMPKMKNIQEKTNECQLNFQLK